MFSARSGSHLGHTGAVPLRRLHHQLDLATRPPFFTPLPLRRHFSCFPLNVWYKLAAESHRRGFCAVPHPPPFPLLSSVTPTSSSSVRSSCRSTSTWSRSWRQRRWQPISFELNWKTRKLRSRDLKLKYARVLPYLCTHTHTHMHRRTNASAGV